MARLIRGEVLSLREREFVHAARVIGMPTSRILFKELLPNLTAPIVISISLMLPAFVAAEAGLAFLGIGVTGSASWGQTISKAVPYWSNYPLYLWEPLVGVVALVLAPQPPGRRGARRVRPQDPSLRRSHPTDVTPGLPGVRTKKRKAGQ